MSRITDLLKEAVEMNLRYTSTLLNLAKDYLKDANGLMTRPLNTERNTERSSPVAPPPPLLIVGRAGETGNGAFVINNPIDREIKVKLVVQGELDESSIRIDPTEIILRQGENAIVRIIAQISDNLPVDRDHLCSVVAPGLASQGIPFIVRRLPDAK